MRPADFADADAWRAYCMERERAAYIARLGRHRAARVCFARYEHDMAQLGLHPFDRARLDDDARALDAEFARLEREEIDEAAVRAAWDARGSRTAECPKCGQLPWTIGQDPRGSAHVA